MPKQPTDPDYVKFEYRSRIQGFPLWRGVQQEGDAAFTDPDQIRTGINIRSAQDGYKSRGGLTRAISNTASSDLDGIFEAGDIGAPALDVAPGSRAYTGFIVPTPWYSFTTTQKLSIDPSQSPVVMAYGGQTLHYANALFNTNRLYLVQKNVNPEISELRQFTSFTTDSLIFSTTLTTGGANDIYDTLDDICISGTTLYMAGCHQFVDGTAEIRIWSWTGAGSPAVIKTFTTTAFNTLMSLIPYNGGLLFAVFNPSTSNWDYNKMTSGGVWSSIAYTPTYFLMDFRAWAATGTTAILANDGNAPGLGAVYGDLSIYTNGAGFASGSDNTGSGAFHGRPLGACCFFNGDFYFSSIDELGNRGYLGFYPSPFSPGTANFGYIQLNTITGGGNFQTIRSIWVQGTSLYIITMGADYQRYVAHSNGADTTTWTLDYSELGSDNGFGVFVYQPPAIDITSINLA